jgi:hypothetical protein
VLANFYLRLFTHSDKPFFYQKSCYFGLLLNAFDFLGSLPCSDFDELGTFKQ